MGAITLTHKAWKPSHFVYKTLRAMAHPGVWGIFGKKLTCTEKENNYQGHYWS